MTEGGDLLRAGWSNVNISLSTDEDHHANLKIVPQSSSSTSTKEQHHTTTTSDSKATATAISISTSSVSLSESKKNRSDTGDSEDFVNVELVKGEEEAKEEASEEEKTEKSSSLDEILAGLTEEELRLTTPKSMKAKEEQNKTPSDHQVVEEKEPEKEHSEQEQTQTQTAQEEEPTLPEPEKSNSEADTQTKVKPDNNVVDKILEGLTEEERQLTDPMARPVQPEKLSWKDKARKVGVGAAGGALTITGLIMIPLPTPCGVLVAGAGMAVLGTEFPKAQEIMDKTRDVVVDTLEKNCNEEEGESEETETIDVSKEMTNIESREDSNEGCITDSAETPAASQTKKPVLHEQTSFTRFGESLKRVAKQAGRKAIPTLRKLGSTSVHEGENDASSSKGYDRISEDQELSKVPSFQDEEDEEIDMQDQSESSISTSPADVAKTDTENVKSLESSSRISNEDMEKDSPSLTPDPGTSGAEVESSSTSSEHDESPSTATNQGDAQISATL